jgi:hypothetical protein
VLWSVQVSVVGLHAEGRVPWRKTKSFAEVIRRNGRLEFFQENPRTPVSRRISRRCREDIAGISRSWKLRRDRAIDPSQPGP